MTTKIDKKLLKKTKQRSIKSVPTEIMEIYDYTWNVVGRVEIKRLDSLWKTSGHIIEDVICETYHNLNDK